MTDKTELKRLAEGAVHAGDHWGRRDSFERQLAKLVSPETVLALIAENEQLSKTADCWDRLNVQNKALSDSFRAERDQSEQDYKAVVGTIELRDIEIAKLLAEVAGLSTGYEAYERVNAELKAEIEKLRRERDARHPFKPFHEPSIGFTGCVICGVYTDHGGLPCPKIRATADAAMGKGEQS